MSSEIQENEIEAVTEKRKNFMRFLKCEFTDLGNCSPPTQPSVHADTVTSEDLIQ